MSDAISGSNAGEGDRLKLYKNTAKADVNDSRRRRNETSIELRRQRRNDDLMKRRNLKVDLDDQPEETDRASSKENIENDEGQAKQPIISIEQATKILSDNPSIDDLRIAFGGIRRLLSSARDPPIDAVINAGLLQALATALDVDDERVQFEAAWALTNIVSGTSEQTVAGVKAGVTPALIRLCTSSSAKVAEQVIWAIANIVGDSAELRDVMISQGLISALTFLVQNVEKLNVSFVQIIAWTLSNLVRHKNPQISVELLKEIAPIIALLLKYPDMNARQDTCWALSFMTDGTDQVMELALENGVVPIVVSFLEWGERGLIPPSLRVLGNFATGADHLTQVVIDTGLLGSVISEFLYSSTSTNKKESCWLISNIVAGTHDQIQSVIDSGVLPLVVDVLRDGDHRGQIEAAWVLANLVHGGTAKQILQLAAIPQAIPTICKTLNIMNNEIVVNMLETLHGILQVVAVSDPKNLNQVALIVEEADGLDNLEKLQHNESEQIYNLAYKIIEQFFNDDDEEEGAGDALAAAIGEDEDLRVKTETMDSKFEF